MRVRLAIAVAPALALALSSGGCSFLISEDLASEDPPPPTEAGADTATVNDDGGQAVADTGSAADTGADAPDAALDPSLVAFWTFDKTASTTQRDETNRYDLVLLGASVDLAGGIRGGAAVFAGSDSPRVDALSGASFPKKGTLSLWFKHAFPDGDLSNQGLFDDYDDQRSHLFIRRIGSETANSIQVALQPQVSSSSYAWVQGFLAPRDQWTHLVLSWDSVARTAALYVNGAIVKASSFLVGENFDPAEQSFQISDGFIGSVDEVRLYDRVLPAGEALLLP